MKTSQNACRLNSNRSQSPNKKQVRLTCRWHIFSDKLKQLDILEHAIPVPIIVFLLTTPSTVQIIRRRLLLVHSPT